MLTMMVLVMTVIQMQTTTEFQTLRITAHSLLTRNRWTTTMTEQAMLASGTTMEMGCLTSSTPAQGTPRLIQQTFEPSIPSPWERTLGASLPHNGSFAMREKKSCRRPTLLLELQLDRHRWQAWTLREPSMLVLTSCWTTTSLASYFPSRTAAISTW